MGITYNKKLVKKDRVITGRGPRDLQMKAQVPIPVSGDRALVAELRQQITTLTARLDAPVSKAGFYTPEQVDDEILKAIKAETSQLKLDQEKALNVLEVKNIKLGNQVRNLIKEKDEAIAQLRLADSGVEDKISGVANEIKSKYDNLLDERDSHLEAVNKAHNVEVTSLKSKVTDQADIIETLKATHQPTDGISTEVMEKLLADATEKLERAAANMGADMTDPDRPKMEEVFVDPLETNAAELEHKIIVEDVSPDVKEVMVDKVNKLKSLMGSLPSR